MSTNVFLCQVGASGPAASDKVKLFREGEAITQLIIYIFLSFSLRPLSVHPTPNLATWGRSEI